MSLTTRLVGRYKNAEGVLSLTNDIFLTKLKVEIYCWVTLTKRVGLGTKFIVDLLLTSLQYKGGVLSKE